MPKQIVCPSGLAGTIRGLRGKEANVLQDRAGAASGANIEEVIRNCWVTTADQGPYPTPLSWPTVLYCDRYYVLFQVSGLTFGDAYPFDAQCTNPRCMEMVPWEVKLNDLPVKPLPDASRAVIQGGKNRFETTTLGGLKVAFQLMDGVAEQKLATALRQKPKEQFVLAAAHRILQVEGVHANDLLTFVGDMELEELHDLGEKMDLADGGIETTLLLTCGKCGWQFEQELPLGGLLAPRRKRK